MIKIINQLYVTRCRLKSGFKIEGKHSVDSKVSSIQKFWLLDLNALKLPLTNNLKSIPYRMKWRNSKERELLSSGGTREQTLPTKNNPNPGIIVCFFTISHFCLLLAFGIKWFGMYICHPIIDKHMHSFHQAIFLLPDQVDLSDPVTTSVAITRTHNNSVSVTGANNIGMIVKDRDQHQLNSFSNVIQSNYDSDGYSKVNNSRLHLLDSHDHEMQSDDSADDDSDVEIKVHE